MYMYFGTFIFSDIKIENKKFSPEMSSTQSYDNHVLVTCQFLNKHGVP